MNCMAADLDTILGLRVPVIVRVGRREMHMDDVLNLSPGSIIELNKSADEALEVMINNRTVGLGFAVKVGENFGLRVAAVGDEMSRIEALRPQKEEDEDDPFGF